MKNTQTKDNSRGLSPLELGIAVLVLGVVLVFLWLRFADLQKEARIGKLQVVRGNVLSANLLVYATALMRKELPDASPCAGSVEIADNSLGASGSVCSARGIIHLANGYPLASATGGEPGILAAAGFLQGEDSAESELAANGIVYTVAAGKAIFGAAGASDPKKCNFEYTQSPGSRIPAVVGGLKISGC
jgi:hypothetical protein